MQMLAAVMILFSGRNLDHWLPIAGKWQVTDEAMVCVQAPASIRSVYESDAFSLTFRYRRSGQAGNRLFIHSKMTTGGVGLWLTPVGIRSEASDAATGVGDEEWIKALVEVTPGSPGGIHAVTRRSDGGKPAETTLDLPAASRGFLRFETDKPGLEIRDVQVGEPGFRNMFKDDSLDGWEIVKPVDPDDPGWVNEKGVIVCRPRKSSWLRTWETYDNFILRLEYMIPPRGNSGIYVRAPIEGRVSRIGFEIQLLDDVGFKSPAKSRTRTGSIYDGVAPDVEVPAPANQWNAIEVLVEGKRVRTTLNGIELYDVQIDDASKDTNHKRPLATRRTVGFLGLQDHNAPVKFRNVRIREFR